MFIRLIMLYTMANISSLLLVIYFFSGFSFTQAEGGYFILIALILALVNYFLDPLIKFFTLKIKFPTVWLFAFLFNIPLLYVGKLVLPGFQIQNGVFKSIAFGNVLFSSFPMSEITVLLASAFILGFGMALIRWLME